MYFKHLYIVLMVYLWNSGCSIHYRYFCVTQSSIISLSMLAQYQKVGNKLVLSGEGSWAY